MKTKVKDLDFDTVNLIPRKAAPKPLKPGLFWRWLIKTIAKPDLKATNFTYKKIGMEKLSKDQPCLVLMNHSCFLDLEIAETIMYPRPLNIICTSDGFVGKNLLMRLIGCIPTNKFVADFVMLKNMKYAIEKLKSSVLMYPEASYSFDGTATPLPATLGKCLKLLNVPVIMIKTQGAYHRQPLYNDLKIRNVKVSAEVKYLLSPEEIQNKSVEELNLILQNEFTFDNWKYQQEHNIQITEPFRADGLNRVLYKCCNCNKEGKMIGKGINLYCTNCYSKWELTDNGFLTLKQSRLDFVPPREFTHIPDWYKWQREEVRKEIVNNTYKIQSEVDIYMMVDTKAIYKVGDGLLTHTKEGFELIGCGGKLHYYQKSRANYSLYSDYNWYEIGDMICIGNMQTLYYCFPKNSSDIVAKARIATEEIYKSLQENII